MDYLAIAFTQARLNPKGTLAKRTVRPEKGWRIIDIVGAPRRCGS